MGKSIDWHMKVARLCNLRWTVEDIAKNLRVKPQIVKNSILHYSQTTEWYSFPTGVSFGNKNETYMTEQEMLIGYQPPKYSELSDEEKAIYKSI